MLTFNMPYTIDISGNLSNNSRPGIKGCWKDAANVNLKPPASILACEIRSPLTSIGLSLELLELNITDPGQKIYVDIIRRSSLQINCLVGLLIKTQQ